MKTTILAAIISIALVGCGETQTEFNTRISSELDSTNSYLSRQNALLEDKINDLESRIDELESRIEDLE